MRDAIRSKYGCSDGAISDSINYKRSSLLNRKIRSYAVNHLEAPIALS